jgi:hypothetical protein
MTTFRGIARRASRFSMRTLLALMTVVAVAMAVWSAYVQPFRAQRDSLAKITALGAQSSSVAALGPSWQKWLVETMVGSNQFVHVVTADLRNSRVTSADVSAMAGLKFLKVLYLDRAELTDSNVSALSQMSALETLSLKYTRLTDDGLAQLVRLGNLRVLYLTGVPITDKAITTLSSMSTLQELYVRWTRISMSGALRLRKTLTSCAVHHHEIRPMAVTAISGTLDN